MKKLLLLLLCVPLIGLGQQTYVPDSAFEAYLEANGMGNGIFNDDSVLTANINSVTSLNVNGQNISDLTGIEDFTALTYLYCDDNQLTSLDVSANTALESLLCYNNQLTSLDVSANTALTTFHCYNNQLNSLNLSGASNLGWVVCRNNQLTSLDGSTNTALFRLDVSNNQLIALDIRNGNNTNIPSAFWNGFISTGNNNLTCINVDNDAWSTANWTNIDPHHYFSNNCPPPTSIVEYTYNRELLKVTDILGREVNEKRNTPLFYIYNDGTVEKKIIIE